MKSTETSIKVLEKSMKEKLDQIKADIEQLRDEVKLKAHLGKEDAKDEFEKLEKGWSSFLSKYKPFADEAEKTAESAVAALGLAAEELKSGYERIKKLL
jgi:hypothetical protein